MKMSVFCRNSSKFVLKGDTLENFLMASELDSFIRELYKYPSYYDEKEPTITSKDLSG